MTEPAPMTQPPWLDESKHLRAALDHQIAICEDLMATIKPIVLADLGLVVAAHSQPVLAMGPAVWLAGGIISLRVWLWCNYRFF